MKWGLFRGLLLNNPTLKLIAIVLAFLLWVQIAGQQRVQRSVSIPVEFINMPPQLVVTNDYPRQVNVVISRPSSVRMDERQLAAVVDMAGTEPGTTVVPLTERNIRNVPSGAQIEGIEQRRIRLQLERIRRKTVSVAPEVIGQPAAGFQLREVRPVPSEVLVSGPESSLDQVEVAGTESIDISGRSHPFSQSVYLDLADPRVRIESAPSVEVIVVIEEQRRPIHLRLPVKVLPEGAKARLSHRTVEATLSVPISYTGTLDTKQLYAYVTLNAGPEPPDALPVSVFVPETYRSVVKVDAIEPAAVRVTLR